MIGFAKICGQPPKGQSPVQGVGRSRRFGCVSNDAPDLRQAGRQPEQGQSRMLQDLHSSRWLRIGVLMAVMAISGCSAPAQPTHPVVTDYGLAPDKWATAWLMARHAVPGAELKVVPRGQPLTAGIAFDVPTSPLRRERDHAAFQSVMDHYRLTDPALLRMAQIVRDIEVNYWGAPDVAESPAVEHAFRTAAAATWTLLGIARVLSGIFRQGLRPCQGRHRPEACCRPCAPRR